MSIPFDTLRSELETLHKQIAKWSPSEKQKGWELYRDLELLRIKLLDYPQTQNYVKKQAENGPKQKGLKSSSSTNLFEKDAVITYESESNSNSSDDDEEKISKLLNEMTDLRHYLDIPTPKLTPSQRKQMYIRMSLALLLTIAWFGALALVLPLRLLHPLLRKLGVPQHRLPIDEVQKYYARSFLYVAGISVKWEGLENIDLEKPVIGFFSHASNLDPYVVCSGAQAFKWVGKRILFLVPIFGWLLRAYGHIPIDRSNRVSAIQSLQKASEIIHRGKRCIAVSPEGTRSHNGRLADFKKGPFYTALSVKYDIEPLLIQGAFELWPPGQPFPVAGEVRVRVLPRIEVKNDDTTASLTKRVRIAFLEGMAKRPDSKARSYYSFGIYLVYLPIIYSIFYYFYSFAFSALHKIYS